MIIASITRPTGDLVITTDAHPKTGAPIVVLAHIRDDETVAHRTALQPSELPQVIAALQIAAQKLRPPGKAQHRTIRASDQLEEDRRLF